MSCLKATDNYQDIIKSSLRDIASSGGLQQVQPLCKSQVRVSTSHYLPHEMTTVHLGTRWTHSGEVITHSAGREGEVTNSLYVIWVLHHPLSTVMM